MKQVNEPTSSRAANAKRSEIDNKLSANRGGDDVPRTPSGRKSRARPGAKPGNPAWQKGMPSPNPDGAPKRGQSFRELVNDVGDLTPDELLKQLADGTLAAKLKTYPRKAQLKFMAVVSAYVSLIEKPDGRLFSAVTDRAEGKPEQPITGGKLLVVGLDGDDADELDGGGVSSDYLNNFENEEQPNGRNKPKATDKRKPNPGRKRK